MSNWSCLQKLLVIGHGRHGKDEVGDMLARLYGARYTSSSEFVGRRVVFGRLDPFYRVDAQGNMLSAEETFEAMFADRSNHRALWKDLIAQYCADNPARVAEEMLEDGYDLYVGMRARREYIATRDLFDEVVWVDRSEHLPPEPPDSMELCMSDATIVIDNNGDLDDLERAVVAQLGPVYGRPCIHDFR